MLLKSCQIRNYKSFRDSEIVSFTRGFNVVVGQNNAGKTALIEALSLQFQQNLHRSIQTIPQGQSSIRVEIACDKEKVYELLSHAGLFSIYLNLGENGPQAIARFQNRIEDGLKVRFSFGPSGYQESDLVNLPKTQIPVSTRYVMERNALDILQSPHGTAKSYEQIVALIGEEFRRRIYAFRAERLNVHQGPIGINSVLASDARNLPEVLHLLQSSNRARFSRFVKDVCTVFPDIKDITVTPIQGSTAQIFIWFVEPETERKDLAIPLSDCGTGIGQVLAMLYVITEADDPRLILIDEPQSFLHPGAIQKLFEIFKRERNQKHQYVVTTHSPTVVTACSPCNVIMLYRQENETKARVINSDETADLQMFLAEVGARLSDVFGADKILWVEGKTEEICFPLILQRLLKVELQATSIIGVTNVGDLEGRHKKIVFEIYQKLCNGRGLLPPALCFCFDREKLSEAEMAGLTKDSNGLICFIPRRMYENYLINADAITAILNEADIGKTTGVSSQNVTDWLNNNKSLAKYISVSDQTEWQRKIDAAKLLNDLFNALTENRVCYDKLKHGVKLTDWIIRNSPSDFNELCAFLKSCIGK